MPHSLASLRASQLSTQVLRLSLDLAESGDRLVADLGLTSARWQVLGVVMERPSTVASIARELGLARQSVLRSARRLVKDGLAVLAPNPDHRRARLLGPTAHGARAMAEVRLRHEAWAQRIAGELGADELATACRILHVLEQNLSEVE